MTTYKLVPCADSFFIVDARDTEHLTESKYPSAYIRGMTYRNETNADGWKRTVCEPVEGVREFAERLLAALNEAHAPADPITIDDSVNLPEAAE